MIGHLIIWTKYEFTSLELFCLSLRNFFHRFFFSLCFISFYITHIHEYWRRCIKCKLWKSSSCRTFPSVNQAQFESQIRRFILLTSNNESDDSYGEKKHKPREKILLFSNQRQLFCLFCLWIEAFNAIIDPIKSLKIPFFLDISLSHGIHNLCDNLSFNGMKISRNSWVAHISRAWCYQFFHKILYKFHCFNHFQ